MMGKWKISPQGVMGPLIKLSVCVAVGLNLIEVEPHNMTWIKYSEMTERGNKTS